MADRAVRIGPAPPADSYLSIDAIVRAALDQGCDALHPGYGFLAERAAFARAVEDAGLIFVGPSAATIEALGDKLAARRAAREAGVEVVPGTLSPAAVDRPDAVAAILAEATAIGFPLLVKAAAGGGGRGMRRVSAAAGLAAALAGGSREAADAFGDGSVYLEREILPARHIEVQLLGDVSGRVVAIGDRDCSIQRRHQKLVEEAPSIAVSAELRERMGAAAVAAAQAVGYRSAGTCEFLVTRDGSYYFLEMNTRIQVEHPVTELVYGVDLVREQLRIAAGLPMRVPSSGLAPRGWAIECRITSEDPANNFLPSTGRIEYLRPPAGPGIRWDSGVETGDEVTLYYDSMLAKLIVWAPDRSQALTRMSHALEELVVTGVATNQAFHRRLMADAAFQRGEIDIQFLERRPDLLRPISSPEGIHDLAIAAALAEHEMREGRRPAMAPDEASTSQWTRQARSEALR
jgi:acetyl/propionyl-CoA carboxylase alpha subunit